MYEAKFSPGAKLIREDGAEEDLEGVAFVVRPLTNLVRIQASRAATRMDSPMDIETLRASIVSVRGVAVKEWPDWSHANAKASNDVDRACAVVNGYGSAGDPAAGAPNGSDGPLRTGSGGSATI